MSGLKEFLDNLSPEQLIDRLTLALDGTDLGIWDWDLRDNSVQFDRRWCEMLGLEHATTPMELQTWSNLVHPDDLAGCYADIQLHLDGRVERYENIHRMRHADGRWIYILDRGRIAERDAAGQPIRFTGTHFDVTATEQARSVLSRQGQLLQDLIANLPAGVAMFDAQLRLLALSPQWSLDQRLSPHPRVGQSIDELLPDGRWRRALLEALGGLTSSSDEECFVQPSDEERFLRWEIRPWRRVDGQLGGALFWTEDVTASVRQRQEVERARQTRVSSLALFAGGLSHEINSPLQIILAEAEAAELSIEAGDTVSVRESITAIAATARRAAAITRALRTLSRDTRHDPPEPVIVGRTLQEMEALSRSRVESLGVSLSIVDQTDGDAVLGRPAEVLHILLNLVNNALAAARQGQPWVRVEASRQGAVIALRVVDGGPGLPAGLSLHSHTPFVNVTRAGPGSGMGLTIAQGLAARDGGRLLHCVDAPHTTFLAELPRVDGA